MPINNISILDIFTPQLEYNLLLQPHNAYWMNAIQTYYLRGIDVTDPKNFDNIIDKITTKDVKKFTQKLFKGADVVDMIFQPKSK